MDLLSIKLLLRSPQACLVGLKMDYSWEKIDFPWIQIVENTFPNVRVDKIMNTAYRVINIGI